ncbi:hypothetical protein AGMMS49991_02630 [Spirochaetia bacterium]|nr:hypothetical protein AGMMS49991_02630 [Spirochaetia bacterium]
MFSRKTPDSGQGCRVDQEENLNGEMTRLLYDCGSFSKSTPDPGGYMRKGCIGKMDVYFLCPECNGVTNGTGCGDPDERITCNKCDKQFPAVKIGALKPCTRKKVKEKPLFVEKRNANMLIE